MHILVYHVPVMLERYSSLRNIVVKVKINIDTPANYFYTPCFCTVEKNNDTAKRNYFLSKHWDAPKKFLRQIKGQRSCHHTNDKIGNTKRQTCHTRRKEVFKSLRVSRGQPLNLSTSFFFQPVFLKANIRKNMLLKLCVM